MKQIVIYLIIVQKFIKSKQDSEIVADPFFLGNISKDWLVDNMKRTGFNGYVYDFSIDCNATDFDAHIHKCLIKKIT